MIEETKKRSLETSSFCMLPLLFSCLLLLFLCFCFPSFCLFFPALLLLFLFFFNCAPILRYFCMFMSRLLELPRIENALPGAPPLQVPSCLPAEISMHPLRHFFLQLIARKRDSLLGTNIGLLMHLFTPIAPAPSAIVLEHIIGCVA